MLTLIELIAGRPWAIRADIAAHVHGLIVREGIAGLRHLAGLKEGIHAFDEDQRNPQAARGRGRSRDISTVAMIPVIGTLTQRVEIVGSAATRSTADIVAELREAVADPKVDAAVLEFDSPGGEVFGVPEAWQAIRDARNAKPVVAAVNSVAASAGYYLASAADEVWVTPSGMVGSVGVYALHIDASKALEDMGESWEFIVAKDSPFKVEGNPAGPLTAEAREALQADIDRYMGMYGTRSASSSAGAG
jgi:ClpP class serine protease